MSREGAHEKRVMRDGLAARVLSHTHDKGVNTSYASAVVYATEMEVMAIMRFHLLL